MNCSIPLCSKHMHMKQLRQVWSLPPASSFQFPAPGSAPRQHISGLVDLSSPFPCPLTRGRAVGCALLFAAAVAECGWSIECDNSVTSAAVVPPRRPPSFPPMACLLVYCLLESFKQSVSQSVSISYSNKQLSTRASTTHYSTPLHTFPPPPLSTRSNLAKIAYCPVPLQPYTDATAPKEGITINNHRAKKPPIWEVVCK